MSSTSAKAALVPLVLAATWATAHADDYLVTVTPTANLDNVRVFSANATTVGAYTNPTNLPASNPGTTTQGNQALTQNLGTIQGGQTLTATVSSQYGTSAAGDNGTETDFGFLATSAGLPVLSANPGTPPAYANSFASTGVTQSQALAGILSGDLGVASKLFPAESQNSARVQGTTGTLTGSLYSFDASGNGFAIGQFSVTPTPQATPEPASLAALGVGVLGLTRRRKSARVSGRTKE